MDDPQMSKRKPSDSAHDSEEERPQKKPRTSSSLPGLETPNSNYNSHFVEEKMELDNPTSCTPPLAAAQKGAFEYNLAALNETPELEDLQASIFLGFNEICLMASLANFDIKSLDFDAIAAFLDHRFTLEDPESTDFESLPLLCQLVVSGKSSFIIGGPTPSPQLPEALITVILNDWEDTVSTNDTWPEEPHPFAKTQYAWLVFILSKELLCFPNIPADLWNFRKQSASILDLIARKPEFKKIVETIFLPVVFKQLEAPGWTQREAALLALGCVAPGCSGSKAILKIVHRLKVFWQTSVLAVSTPQDVPGEVLGMLSWTFSRYAGYMVGKPAGSEFLAHFVQKILGLIDGRDEKTRQSVCSSISGMAEAYAQPLDLPQIRMLFAWFDPLVKAGGEFALETISSTVGATDGSLKPDAMLLKKKMWQDTARVWWCGSGVFDDLPSDILNLIKQKTITTGENNLIYFDKIFPHYFSEEKTIFSHEKLPMTLGCCGTIFTNCGYSSEKYAKILFRQIFDEGYSIYEFCRDKDVEHAITLSDLLEAVICVLNEAEYAEGHPLVRKYQDRILDLMFKMPKLHTDGPEMFSFYQSVFALLGTLADGKSLTRVPEAIGMMEEYHERYAYDESALNNAIWATTRILHLLPGTHNSLPKQISRAFIETLIKDIGFVMFSDSKLGIDETCWGGLSSIVTFYPKLISDFVTEDLMTRLMERVNNQQKKDVYVKMIKTYENHEAMMQQFRVWEEEVGEKHFTTPPSKYWK